MEVGFFALSEFFSRLFRWETHTLALWDFFPKRIGFSHCNQGDRMFEFAVGLLLLDVMPDTLVLAATYNFVRSATLILFGSSAGALVGRYKRINGG
jgi:hypothetical protein